MAKRRLRSKNREGRLIGDTAPFMVAVTVAVTVWSSERELEVTLGLSDVDDMC
jgi:hypothetical protein